MIRPGLEVADVFRDGASRFLSQYGHSHSREQHQTLRAIMRCRTAELGGQVQFCNDCGHQRIQYHSCRNRHCPKCQGMARAAWVEQRETELLPVPYFHIVFTLPQQLASLALQNKRVMYATLFRAAAETLLELALDPKHLGARIGALMVLHTWGQQMQRHLHVQGRDPLAPYSPGAQIRHHHRRRTDGAGRRSTQDTQGSGQDAPPRDGRPSRGRRINQARIPRQ